MRTIGIVLLVIGVLGLLGTVFMDTSVPSGGFGGRVHNIGLLSEKQNFLLVFGFVALIGAILATRRRGPERASDEWSPNVRKCPNCAEIIQLEAKVCRFCGGNLVPTRPTDDPAVAPTVSALRGAGYQVDALGGDKWRVAHRGKNVRLYPNSTAELRAVGEQELRPRSHSNGEA